MSRKPKVYILPGGYDETHGYCAKLVTEEAYDDLAFELDQLRAYNTALRMTVSKLPNAKQIKADADALAKLLGAIT